MPSTLVHLALGALIAAALFEEFFDARSLGVILFVVIVPDLDTVVGLVVPGTHRAAFHTLLIPLLATLAIASDLRREESWLRARGQRTIRVAWVSVVAYVFAGIAPDLFVNGANLLYPLHDQFYALNGRVLVSNQRGFVQTLWEAEASRQGTTGTTHYATGVDPVRGTEPDDVERVFPIARGGLQVLILLTSTAVTGTRLWLSRG